MTAKQKNLVALLPKVETGDMTMQDAMLKAGYAPTSAREQSAVLGSLGNNAKMQEALRQVGFDEAFLAEQISDGARKLRHGRDKLGYLQTGAGLLNVDPPKKQVNFDATIDDLIKAQES